MSIYKLLQIGVAFVWLCLRQSQKISPLQVSSIWGWSGCIHFEVSWYNWNSARLPNYFKAKSSHESLAQAVTNKYPAINLINLDPIHKLEEGGL